MIVFRKEKNDSGRTCPAGWLLLAAFIGCFCATAANAARAQEPQADQQDLRGVALDWLDNYLTKQVLLKREDVAKIRQTVSQMSPSQLEDWLNRTVKVRDFLESDEWQETNAWLREFLRVQAIYSDDEISELKDRIAAADPDELLDILEDIERKHRSLRSMHSASERNRQASLKARESTIKQQEAAAKAARKSYGGSRPLFGNSQGHAANKYTASKGYRPPPPLVTSREVAREAVRQQVFPGRGYGWRW